MEVCVPIHIEYDTPATVPISDVIDSLVSIKMLIEEGGQNIGLIVPGLTVEKININVRSVSQESPLREILFVSLFLVFQKDLEGEVPPLIEKLTGLNIPENAETVVSLSFLLVTFYGLAYAKELLVKLHDNDVLEKKLDDLVNEMANETLVEPGEIRAKLDEKYKTKARMKLLAATAIKFFKTSKNQGNAEIKIGRRRLEPKLISEIPDSYVFEESVNLETVKNFENITLDLHAQDIDKKSSGWAAVPLNISSERIRMKLSNEVSVNQLWNREKITADITVKYRREGLDFEPYELTVTRVID